MKWIECASCWAEFKVISDSDDMIQYCPFCGVELDYEEDVEDEDEY